MTFPNTMYNRHPNVLYSRSIRRSAASFKRNQIEFELLQGANQATAHEQTLNRDLGIMMVSVLNSSFLELN